MSPLNMMEPRNVHNLVNLQKFAGIRQAFSVHGMEMFRKLCRSHSAKIPKWTWTGHGAHAIKIAFYRTWSKKNARDAGIFRGRIDAIKFRI
jgi:hypothetical protein